MSKKLAEGLDALVLDVKTGSGAFMPDFSNAQKLAAAMCAAGNACNVKTSAIISDMNEPLGKFIGNALEVYECVKILRDEADDSMQSTRELSLELTARMLVLVRAAEDYQKARQLCEKKLRDGAALEKLRENIKLQEGEAKICDNPEKLLDKDLSRIEVKSLSAGFINAIDAKSLGNAICEIGGGRNFVNDRLDHAVGYESAAKIGNSVKQGEVLGFLFCRKREQAAVVLPKLQAAYKTNETKPEPLKLIKTVVE